ncbi:hypothetical protein [Pseudoduganella lutea]|uniref:Uncharacterized protein n=1 Tax=Pseudoduganella lutea TaxID=321985 RepID=A0A4P6KT82_9BURK|nr:hypothetical protein [Pseudoduganella lutea]QBE62329.1 hypothetical protein EWM63_04485 [Pseudoduganella lutea]
MNHPSTPPTKQNKPAFAIIVAIVLILFAGVGLAALMGWLPSTSQAGRPSDMVTPPTEQLVKATDAAPTGATQSSQYTADAGTVGNQPVTSGTAAAGSTGGSNDAKAPPGQEPGKPVCANCGVVETVNGQSRFANDNKDGTTPGAAVDNKIESNKKDSKRYDIVVRMHDGQLRTVQTNQVIWRPGDQVKIEGDKLLSR